MSVRRARCSLMERDDLGSGCSGPGAPLANCELHPVGFAGGRSARIWVLTTPACARACVCTEPTTIVLVNREPPTRHDLFSRPFVPERETD